MTTTIFSDTGRTNRTTGATWVVTVTRFAPAGRRPVWTVADVCDGIGEGARDYRTRREALADAASRVG